MSSHSDTKMNKTMAGYADHLTAHSGDTVKFMVSCYSPGSYDADLVRVVCGDTSPNGAGFRLENIKSSFAGQYNGRQQDLNAGSAALADMKNWSSAAASFTFAAAIYPTAPGGKSQAIISCGPESDADSACFLIDETGHLTLQVGTPEGVSRRFSLSTPVQKQTWYIIAASYDGPSAQLTLSQQAVPFHDIEPPKRQSETQKIDVAVSPLAPAAIAFAARRATAESNAPLVSHFNGKIDRPRFVAKALDPDSIRALVESDTPLQDEAVLGFWDFAKDIGTNRISDLSVHKHHGRTYQLPTRAVTGILWTGDEHKWTAAPRQYSAIHFHEDDVYDAGWESDFQFEIPKDLTSGIYAARLRRGEETEYLTFFVSPKLGQPRKKIAFLASTATYLAYANERVRIRLTMMLYGAKAPLSQEDEMLLAHPEFGYSHYEHHKDGSGVHFSSHLRPIMNMRPGVAMWSLNADTNITNWLEARGYDYDLITDDDLHMHGATALEAYDVVITGTHPEYYSTAMLDGVEAYLNHGGRMMYMGGNGFYWRIAYNDDFPGAIEVRRAEDGTRAWASEPGEYYQEFDGAYGGLWRRQNRAPNRLVGIGFAAQGFDGSSYYRRKPGADDPRARFIFQNVDDEIIGDFGSIGGGAAGEEIDRFDELIGSPGHALVLASSENHRPGMLRVKEEFLASMPHGSDPDIRADMVFFETISGGAVFSTGSIAWSGSLAHNSFDNNIARITENVLNRFADPTPFAI